MTEKPKYTTSFTKTMRSIASVTLCLFTWTSIAIAAPEKTFSIKVPEKYGRVKQRWRSPKADTRMSTDTKATDDHGYQKSSVSIEQSKAQDVRQSDPSQSVDGAGRTIIHIQDAHSSFEAQKNIASIIENLVQKEDVAVVGVEGAVGDLDVASFRSFPIKKARDTVSEDFVQKGILSGSELSAIHSEKEFTLFGAEDKSLFHQNFRTYYETLSKREDILQDIADLESILGLLRDASFSPEMKQYDEQFQAYSEGTVNFIQFLPFLFQSIQSLPSERAISLEDLMIEYTELCHFRELLLAEKQINFEKARHEATVLSEKIRNAQQSDTFDPHVFLSYADQYANKNLGEKEYMQSVRGFAFKAGVDCSSYTSFTRYCAYLEKYAQINFNQLMNEVVVLAREVFIGLSSSVAEKKVAQLRYNTMLLKRLCELRAVNEEVTYFRNNKDSFNLTVMRQDIRSLSVQHSVTCDLSDMQTTLADVINNVDNFYTVAEERNAALVDNLIARMSETDKSTGILVGGGYHTEGLTEEFRKKGINYLVVTPNISALTDDIPYLAKMTGELYPLQPQLTSYITGLTTYISDNIATILKDFKHESAAEAIRQELITSGVSDMRTIIASLATLKDDASGVSWDGVIETVLSTIKTRLENGDFDTALSESALSRESVRLELETQEFRTSLSSSLDSLFAGKKQSETQKGKDRRQSHDRRDSGRNENDRREAERRDKDEHAKYGRLLRESSDYDRLHTLTGAPAGTNVSTDDIALLLNVLRSQNPLTNIVPYKTLGEMTDAEKQHVMQKDDKVVTFRIPGAASSEGWLGIKTSNDVLGFEATTQIIQVMRALFFHTVEDEGLIQSRDDIIESTYKSITFLVKNKNRTNFNDRVDTCLNRVQNCMRHIFNAVSENDLAEGLVALGFTSPEFQAEALTGWRILQGLDVSLEDVQYQVDIGASVVQGSTNKARVMAIINANQAIPLGHMTGERVFTQNAYQEFMETNRALRTLLKKDAPQLFDEEQPDILNAEALEILRGLQDWGALARDGGSGQEFFETASNYKKAQELFSYINVQDYIKRWEMDESHSLERGQRVGRIMNSLQEMQQKAEGAHALLTEAEAELLAEARVFIATETKLPSISSHLAFHGRAPPMNDPVYVTIDVKGMGIKNLTTFQEEIVAIERALLDGEADWKEIENLWKTAADSVTRDFFRHVATIMSELQKRGIDMSADAFTIMLGGDECTFAIEGARDIVTPDFLHWIRTETGTRVAASKAIHTFREQFSGRDIQNELAHAEMIISLEGDQKGSRENGGITRLKKYEKLGFHNVVIMQNEDGSWTEYPSDVDIPTIYKELVEGERQSRTVDLTWGTAMTPAHVNDIFAYAKQQKVKDPTRIQKKLLWDILGFTAGYPVLLKGSNHFFPMLFGDLDAVSLRDQQQGAFNELKKEIHDENSATYTVGRISVTEEDLILFEQEWDEGIAQEAIERATEVLDLLKDMHTSFNALFSGEAYDDVFAELQRDLEHFIEANTPVTDRYPWNEYYSVDDVITLLDHRVDPDVRFNPYRLDATIALFTKINVPTDIPTRHGMVTVYPDDVSRLPDSYFQHSLVGEGYLERELTSSKFMNSSYMPWMELEGFTGVVNRFDDYVADIRKETGKKYYSDAWERLYQFASADNRTVLAHGVADGKGGIAGFLSVLLEGEVRKDTNDDRAYFGPITNLGMYAPFYVIVDDAKLMREGKITSTDEISVEGALQESYHKYYIVPSDKERDVLIYGLKETLRQGLRINGEMFTSEKYKEITAKLLTYDEFIDQERAQGIIGDQKGSIAWGIIPFIFGAFLLMSGIVADITVVSKMIVPITLVGGLIGYFSLAIRSGADQAETPVQNQDGISRKEFLKMVGLGVMTMLVPDVLFTTAQAGIVIVDGPTKKAQPVVTKKNLDSGMRSEKMMAGDYIAAMTKKHMSEQIDTESSMWKLFIHYVNTSDWERAAQLMFDHPRFIDTFETLASQSGDTAFSKSVPELFGALRTMMTGSMQFKDDPSYEVLYLDGRYPVYYDAKTGFSENVDDTYYFRTLDRLNNLFKEPLYTDNNSPVYIGGAHYWALLGWKRAERAGYLFQADNTDPQEKRTKTTLIHYDAHKDLGVSRLSDKAVQLYAGGTLTDEQYGHIAQSADIDSFITPAIYEGLIDEFVWVVPEAARSSSDGYVPEYGEYDFYVGLDPDGETGLVSHAPHTTISEVGETSSWDGVDPYYTNIRKIKIHIVSPKNSDRLKEIASNADSVMLDVDEDFFGTDEPLDSREGDKSLPSFLTNYAEYRSLKNSFTSFYASPELQEKMRVVTIARSPNFTYKGEERTITADLINIVADKKRSQPQWAQEEKNKQKYIATLKKETPAPKQQDLTDPSRESYIVSNDTMAGAILQDQTGSTNVVVASGIVASGIAFMMGYALSLPVAIVSAAIMMAIFGVATYIMYRLTKSIEHDEADVAVGTSVSEDARDEVPFKDASLEELREKARTLQDEFKALDRDNLAEEYNMTVLRENIDEKLIDDETLPIVLEIMKIQQESVSNPFLSIRQYNDIYIQDVFIALDQTVEEAAQLRQKIEHYESRINAAHVDSRERAEGRTEIVLKALKSLTPLLNDGLLTLQEFKQIVLYSANDITLAASYVEALAHYLKPGDIHYYIEMAKMIDRVNPSLVIGKRTEVFRVFAYEKNRGVFAKVSPEAVFYILNKAISFRSFMSTRFDMQVVFDFLQQCIADDIIGDDIVPLLAMYEKETPYGGFASRHESDDFKKEHARIIEARKNYPANRNAEFENMLRFFGVRRIADQIALAKNPNALLMMLPSVMKAASEMGKDIFFQETQGISWESIDGMLDSYKDIYITEGESEQTGAQFTRMMQMLRAFNDSVGIENAQVVYELLPESTSLISSLDDLENVLNRYTQMHELAGDESRYLFEAGFRIMHSSIKTVDDIEAAAEDFLKTLQMCAGVEDQTARAIRDYAREAMHYRDLWSTFIKPILYDQTVGAFLCLDSAHVIFRRGGMQTANDVVALRDFIKEQGVQAYDVLQNFVGEGYRRRDMRDVAFSEEVATIQAFLEIFPYPIIEVYELYKKDETQVAALKERCDELHSAIVSGAVSDVESDPLYGAMLYHVFPPAVTTDRQQYESILEGRIDRQHDVAIVPEALQEAEFEVQRGAYTLKDVGAPLDQSAWQIMLGVARTVNKERIIEYDTAEKNALAQRIIDLWQSGQLYPQRKEAYTLLYRYFRATRGQTLPESVNQIQEVMAHKQFLGDTIIDLVRELFDDYQEMNETAFNAVLSKMLKNTIDKPAGKAKAIQGIRKKFGHDTDATKARVAGVLRIEDAHAFNAVWNQIVDLEDAKDIAHALQDIRLVVNDEKPALIVSHLLQGNDYKVMQSEVSSKYDFHEGEGTRTLRFVVSKHKAHGVVGLNMGVCVAPDTQLWDSSNFMNVIIFDEHNIAQGGMHLLILEEDGKKYLTLPGINPSSKLLTSVSSEQLYEKMIDYAQTIAEGIGCEGVLIPTESAIHSNRSEIQRVIQKYSYEKFFFKEIRDFSFDPHEYQIQNCFVVPDRVVAKDALVATVSETYRVGERLGLDERTSERILAPLLEETGALAFLTASKIGWKGRIKNFAKFVVASRLPVALLSPFMYDSIFVFALALTVAALNGYFFYRVHPAGTKNIGHLLAGAVFNLPFFIVAHPSMLLVSVLMHAAVNRFGLLKKTNIKLFELITLVTQHVPEGILAKLWYVALLVLRRTVAFSVADTKDFFTKVIRNYLLLVPTQIQKDLKGKEVIWLNATGVGEVNLLKPVVERMKKEFPDVAFVISSPRSQGVRLAREQFSDAHVIHTPYDQPWILNFFLKRTNVKLLMMAESVGEMPAHCFKAIKDNGGSIVVFNGLKDGNYLPSQRDFVGLAQDKAFGRDNRKYIDLLLMQTNEYADKFVSEGMPNDKVVTTGNIKFDTVLPQISNADKRDILASLKIGQNVPIFVAGSTHDSENDVVVDAFIALKRLHPDLVLVLAPRDLKAVEQIAAYVPQSMTTVRKTDLDAGRIAEDEVPDVVILDTFGDLGKVYSIGTVTFVGGSLFEEMTGHNVIEPATFKKAIVTGPYVQDFQTIVDSFEDENGLIVVEDPTLLKKVIQQLLEDEMLRNDVGNNAYAVLMRNKGALDTTITQVKEVLASRNEYASAHKAKKQRNRIRLGNLFRLVARTIVVLNVFLQKSFGHYLWFNIDNNTVTFEKGGYRFLGDDRNFAGPDEVIAHLAPARTVDLRKLVTDLKDEGGIYTSLKDKGYKRVYGLAFTTKTQRLLNLLGFKKVENVTEAHTHYLRTTQRNYDYFSRLFPGLYSEGKLQEPEVYVYDLQADESKKRWMMPQMLRSESMGMYLFGFALVSYVLGLVVQMSTVYDIGTVVTAVVSSGFGALFLTGGLIKRFVNVVTHYRQDEIVDLYEGIADESIGTLQPLVEKMKSGTRLTRGELARFGFETNEEMFAWSLDIARQVTSNDMRSFRPQWRRAPRGGQSRAYIDKKKDFVVKETHNDSPAGLTMSTQECFEVARSRMGGLVVPFMLGSFTIPLYGAKRGAVAQKIMPVTDRQVKARKEAFIDEWVSLIESQWERGVFDHDIFEIEHLYISPENEVKVYDFGVSERLEDVLSTDYASELKWNTFHIAVDKMQESLVRLRRIDSALADYFVERVADRFGVDLFDVAEWQRGKDGSRGEEKTIPRAEALRDAAREHQPDAIRDHYVYPFVSRVTERAIIESLNERSAATLDPLTDQREDEGVTVTSVQSEKVATVLKVLPLLLLPYIFVPIAYAGEGIIPGLGAFIDKYSDIMAVGLLITMASGWAIDYVWQKLFGTEMIRSLFGTVEKKKDGVVIIPNEEALETIKSLEDKIIAAKKEGEAVVVAIDGGAGAGKTTISEYLKYSGIAGFAPDEIRVLSRDATGLSPGDANIEILDTAFANREGLYKLIILEGQGLKFASELYLSHKKFNGWHPDLQILITISEEQRAARLRSQTGRAKELRGRLQAQMPKDDKASPYDMVIDTPYNPDETPKTQTVHSSTMSMFILGIILVGGLIAPSLIWAADESFRKFDFLSLGVLLGLSFLGIFSGITSLYIKSDTSQNQEEARKDEVEANDYLVAKIEEIEKLIAANNQEGTQIVVAFDGPSGAGKSTISKYIRENGIAGIMPEDIELFERDQHRGPFRDGSRGNDEILLKGHYSKKLVLLDGNGIRYYYGLLDGMAPEERRAYATTDFFVLVTADEGVRRERLLNDGVAPHVVQNILSSKEEFNTDDFAVVIENNPNTERGRVEMPTSAKEEIEFDSYMPDAGYQQFIKSALWANDFELVNSLFAQMDSDADIGMVTKISSTERPYVRNLPEAAQFWYVWKVDFHLRDGRVLETMCKILQPHSEQEKDEYTQEVADVKKAHAVLAGKGLIPNLYIERKIGDEQVLFVEYIDRDNTIIDEEMIIQKVFKVWYESADDPSERWIFHDGHMWGRGNIRFFRNEEGDVDALFVDTGSHKAVDSLDKIEEILTAAGFTKESVHTIRSKVELEYAVASMHTLASPEEVYLKEKADQMLEVYRSGLGEARDNVNRAREQGEKKVILIFRENEFVLFDDALKTILNDGFGDMVDVRIVQDDLLSEELSVFSDEERARSIIVAHGQPAREILQSFKWLMFNHADAVHFIGFMSIINALINLVESREGSPLLVEDSENKNILRLDAGYMTTLIENVSETLIAEVAEAIEAQMIRRQIEIAA